LFKKSNRKTAVKIAYLEVFFTANLMLTAPSQLTYVRLTRDISSAF
jgi:hypothetical protein